MAVKPTVKRIPILLAGLALVLGLCGCSLETSVENLFTLPKVPVEYMGLSDMRRRKQYPVPADGRYGRRRGEGSGGLFPPHGG